MSANEIIAQQAAAMWFTVGLMLTIAGATASDIQTKESNIFRKVCYASGALLMVCNYSEVIRILSV